MPSETSTIHTLDDLLAMPAHNPSMNAVRDALGTSREVIDFCVPVNPYFPTPQMLAQLTDRLPDLLKHYPDYAPTHEARIAAIADLSPECVVAANGSTEIITALCQAAVGPMVTTVPTFGRWTDLPAQHGRPLHLVAHRRENDWRIDVDELIAEVRRHRARSLVICNPNNPTGAWFDAQDIAILEHELCDLDTVIVDESFIDFSGLESAAQLASRSGNLVVVKSLGKSLGWHGMRLGYAVASPERAAALRGTLPWWNVNGIAAFVLEALVDDARTLAAYRASFERISQDRAYLQAELARIPGLVVHPSRANFVYVELPTTHDGKLLRADLLKQHGIYVRECSNKIGSSASYLRIAVLPATQTDALIKGLWHSLEVGIGNIAHSVDSSSPAQ